MTGAVLTFGNTAYAADVATVPLGASVNYSVLGASTVTNTGSSTLNASLGLSPGTSITGFPPGLVVAPGTIETATPAAAQAQSDLTAAYLDAAGRSVDVIDVPGAHHAFETVDDTEDAREGIRRSIAWWVRTLR